MSDMSLRSQAELDVQERLTRLSPNPARVHYTYSTLSGLTVFITSKNISAFVQAQLKIGIKLIQT